MRQTDKIIVGSEEWCALPQLGIPVIKARVDSGAKTSSLHAFNIRGFKRDGVSWVSYELHPIQRNRHVIVRCESEVVDRRMVKSSSGVAEKRYVIKTQLQLAGESWDIEVTLANRDSMGYRMLFGRTAMIDRVLVDPSAKLLCGDHPQTEIDKLYGPQGNGISGLKLGLLASNPGLYSNKRIIEAAEERGHSIRFFDIKRCYMKLDADNPEIHYLRGHTLNDLDAVIPRVRADMNAFGCALIRQFEATGSYSLNSAAAIDLARDKMHVLQRLLHSGLPIPTSALTHEPGDLADLVDMVEGAPLLVKMLEESHREDAVLAVTGREAETVLGAFKSAEANLLVQKYIREAGGMDLRLLVVDGKVVGSMQRRSKIDEFGTRLERQRSGGAVRITQAEKRLAVRAAKALGLKVAGVDIIRSEAGPLLLDVSSTPELREIEQASGKDLASTLIQAVEKRLKWKRPLHARGDGKD